MLRPRLVQILRWERDGSVTVVGTWGDGPNPFPAGSNWPWDDPSLVRAEGAHAGRRTDPDRGRRGVARGRAADAGLSAGVGSAAGAPIVVDGETWGHMSIEMAKGTPLPDRVEERLAEITELVATAISSSATREQLAQLADEQAALRRVATLVARGAPPADVFDAVAEELGRLLDAGSSGLVRFEDENTARVVAGWGRLDEVLPVGARLPDRRDERHHGDRADRQDRARWTTSSAGHPARSPTRRAGCRPAARGRRPRSWSRGGSGARWSRRPCEGDPLPTGCRAAARAVHRADRHRDRQHRGARRARPLADEQAALRRVATLVAEEAPAAELFAKVAEEVAAVFGRADRLRDPPLRGR